MPDGRSTHKSGARDSSCRARSGRRLLGPPGQGRGAGAWDRDAIETTHAQRAQAGQIEAPS